MPPRTRLPKDTDALLTLLERKYVFEDRSGYAKVLTTGMTRTSNTVDAVVRPFIMTAELAIAHAPNPRPGVAIDLDLLDPTKPHAGNNQIAQAVAKAANAARFR